MQRVQSVHERRHVLHEFDGRRGVQLFGHEFRRIELHGTALRLPDGILTDQLDRFDGQQSVWV